MKVPEAMKLTNFTVEEVANLSLHRFIQRFLPGKTLKGLKAHVFGFLPLPPPQPDRAEQRLNCAIDDEGGCNCNTSPQKMVYFTAPAVNPRTK